MKKRWLSLLIGLSTLTGYAQTENVVALAGFKEVREVADNQTLWPKDLYGPMLFVDPQSRRAWANRPDSAGILKPDGGVYTGVLPNDVLIANTAIDWQGRIWSVVLWPLPEDRQERLSLLLHESFHRIQRTLGLPAKDPTVDHLSTMDGRVYFLLELQALKAALGKPVSQRQTDLTNALLFRAKRAQLFPETFQNERVLEMNEGLAEFTGVLLGRQRDSINSYLRDLIDQAGTRQSLIRSAAYLTGPVYGYLLYQIDPRWTYGLAANASFPQLIATHYQLAKTQELTASAITAAIDAYQGKVIIQSERLKENERQELVRHYVDLFTKQPVLTVELVKMTINFNPNTLFNLEAYGTVYPTARIKDRWGELEVEGAGMLMKDWKSVSVPVSSERLPTDGIIQGKGWKLTLNKGWTVQKQDAQHYAVLPAGR